MFPSLILSLLPSLSASPLPPLTNFLSNCRDLLLGVLVTRLASQVSNFSSAFRF